MSVRSCLKRRSGPSLNGSRGDLSRDALVISRTSRRAASSRSGALRHGRQRIMGLFALAPAWLGVLGLMSTVLACQPPDRVVESTAHYEPPEAHEVKALSILDLGVDEAWSAVETAAAASSFRVVASQKQAQFIVLEFLAAETGRPPSDFVDCGAVHREITRDGRTERLDYRVADPSADRVVEETPEGFVIRELAREIDLQIRTTLVLRPETGNRTRLTHNSRYRMAVESVGHSQRIPRDGMLDPPASEPFGPVRSVASFTSFTEGGFSEDAAIRCRPTGEVERLILALVDGGGVESRLDRPSGGGGFEG